LPARNVWHKVHDACKNIEKQTLLESDFLTLLKIINSADEQLVPNFDEQLVPKV